MSVGLLSPRGDVRRQRRSPFFVSLCSFSSLSFAPPARAPDADELAVLSDPDPWEWMKVRMHRLGSYRLRLHKTCTTRRGDTRFEILKPVIVRETFFPMTEEGTKQYDWAKLVSHTKLTLRALLSVRVPTQHRAFFSMILLPHSLCFIFFSCSFFSSPATVHPDLYQAQD